MTTAIVEDLSAAILAADLEPLWIWAEREGLCEHDERGDLYDDEIRDMCLDFSASLNAAEAEATRRAISRA